MSHIPENLPGTDGKVVGFGETKEGVNKATGEPSNEAAKKALELQQELNKEAPGAFKRKAAEGENSDIASFAEEHFGDKGPAPEGKLQKVAGDVSKQRKKIAESGRMIKQASSEFEGTYPLKDRVQFAEGTFGVLYKVKNVANQRVEVLKVAKPDPHSRRDVRHESARLVELHKLAANGIAEGVQLRPTIPCYELRTEEGELEVGYVGVAYDSDLTGALKSKTLSASERVDGGRQLLEGLAHLDRANVRHGDMKALNAFVMRDNDGNVLVHHADLGGARYLDPIDGAIPESYVERRADEKTGEEHLIIGNTLNAPVADSPQEGFIPIVIQSGGENKTVYVDQEKVLDSLYRPYGKMDPRKKPPSRQMIADLIAKANEEGRLEELLMISEVDVSSMTDMYVTFAESSLLNKLRDKALVGDKNAAMLFKQLAKSMDAFSTAVVLHELATESVGSNECFQTMFGRNPYILGNFNSSKLDDCEFPSEAKAAIKSVLETVDIGKAIQQKLGRTLEKLSDETAREAADMLSARPSAAQLLASYINNPSD